MADAVSNFGGALAAAGLQCPSEIIPDGKLHRYHVEGDKLGTRDAWYVLHIDGVPAGSFGHWCTGQKHKWCADRNGIPKAEYTRLIAEAKARREKEDAERQAKAKRRAKWVWNHSKPADSHPYLTAKQVQPHGVRLYKGTLVVPLRDANGELHSLQFIGADGAKRFLTGGRVQACFHTIGDLTAHSLIYICEGYATVATVHEASGQPCLVSFNCGNLKVVAEAARQKWPNANLVLAADNDQWKPGNPGVTKATEAASAVGAKLVVPQFRDVSTEPTDFNDLSRLEGLDEVRRQLEGATEPPSEKYSVPPGFELTKEGVFFLDNSGEEVKRLPVCGPLFVTARTRDTEGRSHGRLLEFFNEDGQPCHWVMPKRLLGADGREYRTELLDMGIDIEFGPKAWGLLSRYIQKAKPNRVMRCVERTGWFGNAFVLPDVVLGNSGEERVLFQSESPSGTQAFRVAGSLEEWQRNLASLCVGNSRLVFSVSCAFAAPLLEPVGEENGGFHWRGTSSTGKSTAQKCAASVFGTFDPNGRLPSWRATVNGLEGLANQHNDALLPLDEIAQVESREAGAASYMLANGSGKQRSNRSGDPRRRAGWRLLFLSSGEISLADHMLSAGKRAHAGQEVRLADIPADTGKHGAFEELHSYPDGEEFSKALCVLARQYHGAAGREYVQRLASWDKARIQDHGLEVQREFMNEHVPSGASGQVTRVAGRFALVAAGGELATHLGVTGWPQGEATEAAATCFKAWLECRGGHTDQEAQTVLRQVRLFFEKHGEARFSPWVPLEGRNYDVRDRAGFRKQADGDGYEYFVFPEVFRTEICAGLDAKFAAKVLVERGLILPGKDGKAVCPHKPPGMKTMRLYHFSATVLDGE